MTTLRSALILLPLALSLGCNPPVPSPGADGLPSPPRQAEPLTEDTTEPAPPPVVPPTPVAVLDYGPRTRTQGRSNIHIRFNQPMVALQAAAAMNAPGDVLDITPKIEGQLSWQTPDLLLFEPKSDLSPAQRYTVTLKGPLEAPNGQVFADPLSWTFETTPPRVTGTFPEHRTRLLPARTPVVITFSLPTSLKQVREHLQVQVNKHGAPEDAARAVAVNVRRPLKNEFKGVYRNFPSERSAVIVPRGGWPLDSTIELTVGPKLVSESGPVEMGRSFSMTIETYPPLTFAKATCAPDNPCSDQYITMDFSTPLDTRQRRHIKIEPEPSRFFINIDGYSNIAPAKAQARSTQVSMEGSFLPEIDYKITIGAGLTDVFGQKLGKAVVHTARIAQPPVHLRISGTYGLLQSTRETTIGFDSRHIETAVVRHQVLTPERLFELYKSGKRLIRRTHIHIDDLDPSAVSERKVDIAPTGVTHWGSREVDLVDLIGGASGAVFVQIEPGTMVSGFDGSHVDPASGVFQVTDLGLELVTSSPKSLFRVVRLSTGHPVSGASVEVWGVGDKPSKVGVTNREGLIDMPGSARWPGPLRDPVFFVRTANDSVLVNMSEISAPRSSKPGLEPGERAMGKMITERGVYRRGETVYAKGWTAVDTPYSKVGLGKLPVGTKVAMALVDRDGRTVQSVKTALGEDGGFDGAMALPKDGHLGMWSIKAVVGEPEVVTLSVGVKVRTFRTPQFKVESEIDKLDVDYDGAVSIKTRASYYSGGAVPVDNFRHSNSCRPMAFKPDGLGAEWQVGVPLERYTNYGGRGAIGRRPSTKEKTQGFFTIGVPGSMAHAPHTNRCSVYVTVRDATLQESVSESSFTAHPELHYLAIKTPRRAVEGPPLSMDLRAVKYDGNRVGARGVSAVVKRTRWTPRRITKGDRVLVQGWHEVTERVQTCAFDLKATGADAVCNIKDAKEGHYTVTLTQRGKKARTVAHFHVAPKSWARWLQEPVKALTLNVGPKTADPGQSVTVVIRSPQKTGRGVLLMARNGLRERRGFNLKDGVATFKMKVTDDWTPEVTFIAHLLKPGIKSLPKFEKASQRLAVNHEHRRIAVQVSAPESAAPRQQIEVKLAAKDHRGRPVSGRAALWVTDEAILSMTSYSVPDLVAHFQPSRGHRTALQYNYHEIIRPFVRTPSDPWEWRGAGGMGARGFGRGGGGSGMGRAGGVGKQEPRKDFRPTPLFLGDVALDARGRATAKVELPDSLTTFRVIAVAAADLEKHKAPGRYGVGETTLQVRAPLVVRAAVPRGLRPGDASELAAVVTNTSGEAGQLSVSMVLEEEGALESGSAQTVTVPVKVDGQVRVPFQVRASGSGAAKVVLSASLSVKDIEKPFLDAMEVNVDVAPEPTLIEHVALYGDVNDDAPLAVPVILPSDVLPDYGGLEISVESTLMGGLQDATRGLIHYPYGCLEQTSSRLLPLVALSDLSKAWPLGIEDVGGFVRAGIVRILSMQTPEGGFAYWPGGKIPNAYASAYATWILQMAVNAGHKVPKGKMDAALSYLMKVTESPDADWSDTTLYYHDIRRTIAVFTLAESGRFADKAMGELFLRDDLPHFARAFLLMALHTQDAKDPRVDAIMGDLLGNITEQPATATLVDQARYGLSSFFHSDTRSTALVLMALLRARPDHTLISKLARGLMDARKAGVWRNTQENAYALFSMASFARIHERDEPKFTAKAWAGDTPIFESRFEGRDLSSRKTGEISMASLVGTLDDKEAPDKRFAFTVQREGQGRMYYRVGMAYAPADPSSLPPIQRGLRLERVLRTQRGVLGAAEGLAAGDIVAMDLTLTNRAQASYVVVDAPIPSGLEPINLDLGKGGSQALPVSGVRGRWMNHQELRSDRALLFVDLLSPGTHTHTVFLRATSPGRYSFPPAKAEEMYAPEVFGRTSGRTLSVAPVMP